MSAAEIKKGSDGLYTVTVTGLRREDLPLLFAGSEGSAKGSFVEVLQAKMKEYEDPIPQSAPTLPALPVT